MLRLCNFCYGLSECRIGDEFLQEGDVGKGDEGRSRC